MDIYFNLIPIELNYIILSKLNYEDYYGNINLIYGDRKTIDYEILFKFRYPVLYNRIKKVLLDDINLSNRFLNYRDVIFDIIYNDLLRTTDPKYHPRPFISLSDLHEFHAALYSGVFFGRSDLVLYTYISKFTSITTDIIYLARLLVEFPVFYKKLGWFPVHINTSQLLHDFARIDGAIAFTINLKKYINTGKAEDLIIFDRNSEPIDMEYNIHKILVYLLVNEYLYNNGNIIFHRETLYQSTRQPGFNDVDYAYYHQSKEFYDDMSIFITQNKDRLKYT